MRRMLRALTVLALALCPGAAFAQMEDEPAPTTLAPGRVGLEERLPPLPLYSSGDSQVALRKELELTRTLLDDAEAHARAVRRLDRLPEGPSDADAPLAAEHLTIVGQLLDRMALSVARLRRTGERLPREVVARMQLDELAGHLDKARSDVRGLDWSALEKTWGVPHVASLLDRSLRPLRRDVQHLQNELR